MLTHLLDKIKQINLASYFIAFIVGTFILAGVAFIMENPPLKEYEGGIQNHLVWDIKGQCFFVRPANNAVYLIRVNDCDKGTK
jgi:glycerol uptake facilitator-like aquaporin|tara:strand:+ start:438 stop:686 length:249 start_codon:yes stop_codon:yes gene_type:complete